MGMPLPRLTADSLRGAVLEMSDEAHRMLRITRDAFLGSPGSGLDQVGTLGRDLHLREKRLTDHVAMQLREYPWSLGSAEHLAFLPAALERVGDSVEALARCIQGIHREGIPFSERAISELKDLFSRGLDLLEGIGAAIRVGDATSFAHIRRSGEDLQKLSDQVALSHQERLLRGVCAPRASSLFLAMLDNFREIERYTRRMSRDLEKAATAG
jgi:Na+/phosphate symporter